VTSRTKRILTAAAQVVLLSAGLWYLGRTAHLNWDTLRHPPQPLDWGRLLLASILWLASYIGLVILWATSLPWWGTPRLRWRAALRVFFLANLARYIPGAVWQFAGLAALALEQGISPLAAAGAVLVQQLVLLATGLGFVVVFAPSLAHPYVPLSPFGTAVLAAVALGALVFGVPALLPRLKRFLERVTGRPMPLPHTSHGRFGAYVAATAVGWIGYGFSFALFSQALLGPGAPGAVSAASAFVASYVAGIIAVFAPGGLVVREAALVAALAPQIGSGDALLLAVGSRIWLTGLEIVGAVGVLLGDLRSRRQGFRTTNTN
jgi:uncharacterized membrane protein YbhN (UPF0104 family)